MGGQSECLKASQRAWRWGADVDDIIYNVFEKVSPSTPSDGTINGIFMSFFHNKLKFNHTMHPDYI